MLGRGGESTYHCGNIAFRQLVEDHKRKYYTCPRAHKSRVVALVVQKWRQLSPPGRFLTRTNPAAGDKGPWHDVGDGRALKKTSHSLRDAVRCFTVEKRQRAAQGLEEAEISANISVDISANRKRGRPELIQSVALPHPEQPVFDGRLVSVVGRKPKICVLPAFEERQVKKQRVVYDERDEAQDDCHREGLGEEDGVRACGEGEGRDRFDCDVILSAVSFSPPQETFVPLVSCFNPPKPQQGEPMARLPSPCGSADWFTPATEDLPVQAVATLPPANVLVQEVVVSSAKYDQDEEDDENSVDSWCTEREQDMALFTKTLALLHPSCNEQTRCHPKPRQGRARVILF